MFNRLKLIFLLNILGVSNGAILPGSQKEDSVKEQSFGIIYNPQYLFYVSDTGDIKKISNFYVDYDKVSCDDSFLPISWFVRNSKNEDVLLNGFMNHHGFLENSNLKSGFCALVKKFFLNKDNVIVVSDNIPKVVPKKEIHEEISKILWNKSSIDWAFHEIHCYNEKNRNESIGCAAKHVNFYLTIVVVIIVTIVKFFKFLVHFYRRIMIVLSVVNALHNSHSKPNQEIHQGNECVIREPETLITSGRRKRVPNSKYS